MAKSLTPEIAKQMMDDPDIRYYMEQSGMLDDPDVKYYLEKLAEKAEPAWWDAAGWGDQAMEGARSQARGMASVLSAPTDIGARLYQEVLGKATGEPVEAPQWMKDRQAAFGAVEQAGKPEADVPGWLNAVGQEVGGATSRGVASAIGFPADILSMAYEGLGGLLSGHPVQAPEWMGGRENILNALQAAGMPTAKPQTMPGRMLENTAAAAAGMAPLGMLASKAPLVASAMTPRMPIVGEVVKDIQRAPNRMAAMELASGMTSGAGGYVGEKLGDGSPWAEIGGEIVGGMLNPYAFAISHSGRAPKGFRSVRDFVEPHLGKGGAKNRAARELQESLIEEGFDPGIEAGKISGSSPLSPAQQTGNPFLLGVESALIRGDRKTLKSYTEYLQGLKGAAGREIKDIAPDDPGLFTKYMDDLVETARDRASDRLSRMTPETRRIESNRIYRHELDNAFDLAKKAEREAWDAVNLETKVDTTPLKRLYSRIMAESKKADAPIPDAVSNLLDPRGTKKLADMDTIAEVKALRTRLHDLSSGLKSGTVMSKDRNLARKLDMLASEALDVMSQPTGDEFVKARRISRELNETFRQGIAGDLLGKSADRGLAVQPEVTLETGIGTRTGPAAASRVEAMRRAVNTPESQAALSDFLKHRFLHAVAPDGKTVNPKGVDTFIARNKDVIDLFPDMEANFREVASSKQALDRAVRLAKTASTGFAQQRRAVASTYLGESVESALDGAMAGARPGHELTLLARQASKDPSGAAMKGLKAQFVEDMIDSSMVAGNKGFGAMEIDPAKLNVQFQKLKSTAKLIFNEGELARLQRITNELGGAQRQLAISGNIDEFLKTEPDQLIDLLSRVAGANIGGSTILSKASGASLVMAQHGSRMVRKFTDKIPLAKSRDILREAVLDPQLYSDLLTRSAGAKGIDKRLDQALSRIHAYMLAAMPESE